MKEIVILLLAFILPIFAQGSRCNKSETYIGCTYRRMDIPYEYGSRTLFYEFPLGTPPEKGWPVVIFFQGSFFKAEYAFWSYAGEPFGAYYQTDVVKNLLDHGYAVLAPNAGYNGSTFWNTNIPPFDFDWSIAPDHYLMLKLFDMIKGGVIGPLDFNNMHATGISSGGYMTSRMAISYTKYFRSLVVAAGSYCVCGGPVCPIPDKLPEAHPPTLFLHGEIDVIVPIITMRWYHEKLLANKIDTQVVVNLFTGHAWISESPPLVYKWFDKYTIRN